MSPSLLLAFLSLLIPLARCNQHILSFEDPSGAWQHLYTQVEGRLYHGVPFAQACFEDNYDPAACAQIQSIYVDEVSRTNYSGAYINTQWETCQATGAQCLLDYTNPKDSAATHAQGGCQLGSVSSSYIDVQKPEDVTAAFEYSRETKIPLVIKNTGHDYKGRSSAPGSLALWTHNLKNMSYDPTFVPTGCSTASPAVKIGAGVQWGQAYAFAEANNITLVGGSDKAVGASGGWLQGGGHGALSNTMGMGVDRVLQFVVVTPDGEYRIANACQNQDLFFALRGGGGGTFGVVLESTALASPPVTLQAVLIAWDGTNSTLTSLFWTILVDNALTWVEDGWGGFLTANAIVYINPKLTKEDAQSSMAPLIKFATQVQNGGVKLNVVTFPTWGSFFAEFASAHVAITGNSLALASRLISKSNFATPSSRADLRNALLAAEQHTPGLIMLMGPPASFPGDGQTSINPAWRDSVYHVTVVSGWNWNATLEEKKEHYEAVSHSIDNLRRITPDAAYLNEADVYQENHEVTFWGSNYPELLRIKQKYDPEHLLDCWQCVGWNPQSPRFSCYL